MARKRLTTEPRRSSVELFLALSLMDHPTVVKQCPHSEGDAAMEDSTLTLLKKFPPKGRDYLKYTEADVVHDLVELWTNVGGYAAEFSAALIAVRVGDFQPVHELANSLATLLSEADDPASQVAISLCNGTRHLIPSADPAEPTPAHV